MSDSRKCNLEGNYTLAPIWSVPREEDTQIIQNPHQCKRKYNTNTINKGMKIAKGNEKILNRAGNGCTTHHLTDCKQFVNQKGFPATNK